MLLLPSVNPSVQPQVIITGQFESTVFLGQKQQQQQIKSWFHDTLENGKGVENTEIFFSL